MGEGGWKDAFWWEVGAREKKRMPCGDRKEGGVCGEEESVVVFSR